MRLHDRNFVRWALGALGLALILLAAAPAAAAPSDLGRRILGRYDVQEVDGAIRLFPHDADSAVRSIEVSDDGEVLVNGKEFDEEELSSFLGRDGDLIGELVDLDVDERRSALGIGEAPREVTGESGRSRSREGVQIDVPTGLPGSTFKVRVSGEDRVSVGHSIEIGEDEIAHEVVCIGCSIRIKGEASSDVTAVGGSVKVSGRVGGSATAVGGSVEVADGAVVEDDAVAIGGAVELEGSGRVEGQNTTVGLGGPWLHGWRSGWIFPWGMFDDFGGFVTAVMRTGVLALLGVLAVLLAGPTVERLSRRAGGEPWKAVFAGLMMQLLFLPLLVIVVVVLAISIIGIPLLALVPFALLAFVIGVFLGFVGVARAIGGWAEERFGWSVSSAMIAVILGVVLIQATSLAGRALSMPGGVLAIVGFTLVGLGFFLKYLAWTIGLGAMTLMALSGDWRRRRNEEPASGEVPPPPPPTTEGAVAEETWPSEPAPESDAPDLEGPDRI